MLRYKYVLDLSDLDRNLVFSLRHFTKFTAGSGQLVSIADLADLSENLVSTGLAVTNYRAVAIS